MDLSFSSEERAFREEMRTFFRTAIPADIRDRAARGEHVRKQDLVIVQQALNQAGLAVPHWPAAWGGRDWTPIQSYIWLEEMQLACVPPPLAFNTSMVGPVIAQFRQRGAEGAVPAGDGEFGYLVVSGVFRARRWVGFGEFADVGEAGW